MEQEQEHEHCHSRTAQPVGQLWSAEGEKALVGCLDLCEARSTTSAGRVEILTRFVRTYGSDTGDRVLNGR